MKYFEDNIGVNLCNLGSGNCFLNLIPKAQVTKNKVDKLDIINIKNVLFLSHATNNLPSGDHLFVLYS